MKNTREQLDILNAYRELGSYRAAARLCRTTDKTVKRVVQRLEAGGPYERRPRRLAPNTESVKGLIEEKVRATDGLISAKRLLPVVRAAGYRGSARNLRRAVQEAKAGWRQRRRLYRPWVPVPGQHLVIDWTPVKGGLQMFCAVLAWSRYRFVRFAHDQRQETTLRLLAECLEELDGVPAVANWLPSKVKEPRTSPGPKPNPLPFPAVRLLPSRISSPLLSPGHQLIMPSGAGVHGHLPVQLELEILRISAPVSARLKISTSSVRPLK